VQGRDSWQALQKHLAAARAAAEAGDREVALASVNAALEIDRDFLAAQALRERLLKGDPAAMRRQHSPSSTLGAVEAPKTPESAPALPRDVSPESYAKFQERARHRRVETRVTAVRDAIRRRRFDEAAAALDEVNALEPQHPELAALTGEFDALRRHTSRSHRGPWAAAAAAFIATTLGASYLQDSSWLMSRPLITSGILMPAGERSLLAAVDADPVGTSGDVPGTAVANATPTAAPEPRPAFEPRIPIAAPPRLAQPADAVAVNLPPPQPAAPLSPPPPSPPSQPSTQQAPAPATPAPIVQPPVVQANINQPPSYTPPAVAAVVPPQAARRDLEPDDSALVQNTLQRYRRAYQDLDAQSAQAVWPTVNEAALARAFEGLESQALTFDACNVRVIGEAATATCRGSARYVPRIGSRVPRVEPRVWNFTLKKSGSSWTIDTARAER
jgi:hypothetical protein